SPQSVGAGAVRADVAASVPARETSPPPGRPGRSDTPTGHLPPVLARALSRRQKSRPLGTLASPLAAVRKEIVCARFPVRHLAANPPPSRRFSARFRPPVRSLLAAALQIYCSCA